MLLPLPWVLRWVLPAKQRRMAGLWFPFFTALVSDSTGSSRARWSLATLLSLLIWLLIIAAACGPRWLGEPIPLPQAGRSLMLALDLSGSMRIPDMKLDGEQVNRLHVVKATALEFVQQRAGDRLGLILFGTKAYLQTPLTFDRKTVMKMIADATIGLAGAQTAIGDAIALGIKRLDNTDARQRVLILLTDGASNAGVLEPLAAAKIAADHHIKIYTIGIGANRLVIPGLLGPQVINAAADLDEDTLKTIAKQTGGMFFRAQNTEELRQVYTQIDKLEPVNSRKLVYRPSTDYFYIPLLLALLLSLFFPLRRQVAYG